MLRGSLPAEVVPTELDTSRMILQRLPTWLKVVLILLTLYLWAIFDASAISWLMVLSGMMPICSGSPMPTTAIAPLMLLIVVSSSPRTLAAGA